MIGAVSPTAFIRGLPPPKVDPPADICIDTLTELLDRLPGPGKKG